MKKIWLITGMTAILLAGCSPRYVKDGSLVAGFDTGVRYNIAVLTPYVTGGKDAGLSNRMQQHAASSVSKSGNLIPVNSYQVQQSERIRSLGMSSQPSPSAAREIGAEVGADLVMITEIGTGPVAGDVIAPLYCSVSVIDVASGSQVYSGSARSANPVSKEGAAVHMIEAAIEALVKAF